MSIDLQGTMISMLQNAQNRPEPSPLRNAMSEVGGSAIDGIGRGMLSGAVNMAFSGGPMQNAGRIIENSKTENILGNVFGNAVGGVVGHGTTKVAQEFLPDNFLGRGAGGIIGDRVEIMAAEHLRDGAKFFFGKASETSFGGSLMDGLAGFLFGAARNRVAENLGLSNK